MPENHLRILLPRPVDSKWPIGAKFMQENTALWKEGHKGVDFVVPVGENVTICLPGAVQLVGWDPKGFLGLRTWILSPHATLGMVRIAYCHLSKLDLVLDQEVERVILGKSGATGINRAGKQVGPHLHLQAELWPSREPLEPIFT